MKLFTLALTLAAALGACKAKPEDKPPDNTAQNQRDKAAVPTADQAGQNKSDVSVAADVRKSLMNDSTLSTNAHNCKVIVNSCVVTLAGPVANPDEKAKIESLATVGSRAERSASCSASVRSPSRGLDPSSPQVRSSRRSPARAPVARTAP